MNVTFLNVLRSRPIVLTAHDVRALSRLVGRAVLPELQAMCEEHYEIVRALRSLKDPAFSRSIRRTLNGFASRWLTRMSATKTAI